MNTFIFATGRSGSTWVFNLLWRSGIYNRNLFEPFKNYNGRFNNYKYINPGNNDTSLINSFNECISISNKEKFANKYNPQYKPDNTPRVENVKQFEFRKKVKPVEKPKINIPFNDSVLVKEILINLKAPWVVKNINNLLCLMLFRNPFSVISSHMNLEWGFRKEYTDELLLKDILGNFQKNYRKDYSELEQRIWWWCVNNCIPLILLKDKANLLFYENFVVNRENEVKKIFNKYNIPINSKVINELNTPSQVTTQKVNIRAITPKELVLLYKNKIPNDIKNKCLDIFKVFGADDLYDWETFMPNVENFEKYYLKF